MTVVTSKIMKYCRNLFGRLKIYISTLVVTMSFPVTWQWSLTFSSSSMSFSQIQLVLLDWNCSSSSLMIKCLLKYFFITFFAVFILLKNCFNKFISSIFISKDSYWLTESIINTNNLVSKIARNVILIFFWIEPFIDFSTW